MTTNTKASTVPAASTHTGPARALQRAGGLAALAKAATYIVGFAVMGAYLAPRGFLDAQGDPAESLSFLLANQSVMYLWYLTLYVVGGLALVVLVQALRARMPQAPTLSATAGVLGYLWSGLLLASGMIALVGQRAVVELAVTDPDVASSTWSSVSVVQDAVGGGIEIVGGLWVLLVSIAGMRTRSFGRGLSVLGIGVGLAGACTLVPAAADAAGSLFGLGMIVWFVWSASTLLSSRR